MAEVPAGDGDATAERPNSPMGRVQRIIFRCAALFFCLVWLGFCFGLIDLSYLIFVVAPAPEPDASAVSDEVGVLEVAYGAVATFMVAGAFLRQVWAPGGCPAATQQIVALTFAFGLAGALGLDVLAFISVTMLVVMQAILLAVYPGHRPHLLPNRRSVNRRVLLVTAVGALPWLVYAWNMSANSRAHLIPEEQALRPQAGGWAGAAVLSFAVLLLAMLSSTRTPGWRLPLWTTIATVLSFALMTVRYPVFPGSPGRLWGALAAAWVIALLITAQAQTWRGRRLGTGTTGSARAAGIT